MQFMETDMPDNYIRDLKCLEEGDTVRLTFRWPSAIEQVYIFKTGEDFDIGQASPKAARLYTLPEYKKQAGFVEAKTPGIHTYRVYPFIRENGEDTAVVQPGGGNAVTCLTGQITVYFSIEEKRKLFSAEKINIVRLQSEYRVDDGVLCYVKKENAYPAGIGDGTVYFFGEPLNPGEAVERRIKTNKNEYLRIFVHDPGLAPMYKLQLRGSAL